MTGSGLYVQEVIQPGFGFGSIKCYTDHLNDDNWEWLKFGSTIPTGEVHCIAYNVPADREITITKHFVNTGDYKPVAGDLPEFTLNPDVPGACLAPVWSVDMLTATITCTVPYAWNGTITETPAKGWAKVSCEEPRALAAVDETPKQSDWDFCNQPYGQIRIEKVDGVNGATGPLWDFTVGGNFAAPDGTAYTNPAKADQGTPFESGHIGLSNTAGNGRYDQCSTVEQPNARRRTYYTIAT